MIFVLAFVTVWVCLQMARFVVVSGLPQTASRKEVTEYFRPCGKSKYTQHNIQIHIPT